uniref:Uncharacterized protein n=1 Tax=Megaselia scalaris TaxID=36166 RepID=T1GA16_MEGSC
SKNSLESITCFGNTNLSDLCLLKTINIRENKLKSLPDQINLLTNLRELLVGSNCLTKLPSSINSLQYLEHLDVSDNQLTSQSLDVIKCMPSLRIFNITGNKNIKRLPKSLATCDNLYDLVIDVDNFEWPELQILQSSTPNILNYLITGEFSIDDNFDTNEKILNNEPSLKEEEIQSKVIENTQKEETMDCYNEDMLLAFKKQQEQKQQ